MQSCQNSTLLLCMRPHPKHHPLLIVSFSTSRSAEVGGEGTLELMDLSGYA